MPARKGARPHETKQRRWYDDPLSRERVETVYRLTCEGWSITQIARELEISPRLVGLDRSRAMQQLDGKLVGDAREHIAQLEWVVRKAHLAFDATSRQSLNRSGYLSIIEKTVMSIAKLDGTLKERVEHSGPGGGPIEMRAAPAWLTPEFVARVDEVLAETAPAPPRLLAHEDGPTGEEAV